MKEEALKYHENGKIGISVSKPLKDKNDLSLAYTPGVAEVCLHIKDNPSAVFDYTLKKNTVAIISDGSRVLGLGKIGAEAAIPVMEGKAMIFKKMANIDAFPICIKTQDKDEFINIVKNISPVFGGINLEDIEVPKCFEIEEALQGIGIPVMHDDQHGTAIVALAGLLNAAKVAKKDIDEMKIVVNGAGAAGSSIVKLLKCHHMNKDVCIPVKEIIVCDSNGIISRNRKDLKPYKKEISMMTNAGNIDGSLEDALHGADAFIGASSPDVLAPSMIKLMNDKPIIFALANPKPEIMPEEAMKAGAFIMATGRSDYPNQINNMLAFPGIFRGALDSRAKVINNEMKLAAAHAIANTLKTPSQSMIIPNSFDMEVPKNVAAAVKAMAITTRASK
ncbi:MAG TPA: NADP-dependent malic enzyme [Candidatus Nanoarchaeia archaeon]|nr:NADP-dependent malic enzyme [Candidatus Nanoarchaeia archaeon]